MDTYLAIDIGASSGRHILGRFDGKRLVTEEIYRFDNNLKSENGHLLWDVENLLFHVKEGIRLCGEKGHRPKSVAIDTWGVDYVLLDENKKEILPVFAYRDPRCAEGVEGVNNLLSDEALFAETGIAKQSFNTVFQLWWDKKEGRLSRARHFLMMPEYLSFKLCGVMANEYTNASTTGLLNARDKTWSKKILSALGYPEELFLPLSLPGTPLGFFTPEVREEVGFDCLVLLCPSHDTASAVAAIPVEKGGMYVSSGTWSLVGTELLSPALSEKARLAGFTNEGGVDFRFRFLKNIMGMWIFQSIRRDLGKTKSYDEMMEMAMESQFAKRFDPTSPLLLAPENMMDAIRSLLEEKELSVADVLSAAYHSLAHSYKKAAEEIEAVTGEKITSIRIVGGGSRDRYLNRLVEEVTGRRVHTGPIEATSLGNLLSQIQKDKSLSLTEARDVVKKSYTKETP